jgi:hypothetical protein
LYNHHATTGHPTFTIFNFLLKIIPTHLRWGRNQWHFIPDSEVWCGEKLSKNKQLSLKNISAQHKTITWQPGKINIYVSVSQ